MAIQSKSQVPVALANRSNQDLSCQHITTADFMQWNVAKCIEMVPDQTLDIQHMTFSRLDPLVAPTFGNAKIINRAFFVPYRTIFAPWNDFITDTPHTFDGGGYGYVTEVVGFSQQALRTALRHSEFTTIISADAEVCDILYQSHNSEDSILETVKYNYTAQGRKVIKLLRSLGYSVVWTNEVPGHDVIYSALPLLSALRVYLDFYYPAQYYSSQEWSQLAAIFTDNSLVHRLNDAQLYNILNLITSVSYSDDYFVNAWDSPELPVNGTPVNIYDATSLSQNDDSAPSSHSSGEVRVSAFTGNAADNSPRLNAGGSPLYNISQYALTALQKLTNYMRRHQIVGSRTLERYLARFGVKLSSEKLNRSVLINSSVQSIKFGDVTSTSSTDGASLGDFAGKGVSMGQDGYSVSSNGEYGMFIVISTIVPDVAYYEGVNKHCLHRTKLDFFTPEFDALGTQPLTKAEVFAPANGDNYKYHDDIFGKIFGFVPRYAEYKVPYNQLTGDYVLGSRNVGKDSWHLMRSLQPYFDSVGGFENFVHDYNFVVGQDSEQYNRIFQVVDGGFDHFNIIHDFNIKSSFPGKSLYDTYDFGDEDDNKKITMDINGETLN